MIRHHAAMDRQTQAKDGEEALRNLYLDIIKRSLTGLLYEDMPRAVMPIAGIVDQNPKAFVRKWREWGRDYPSEALTMIGLRRMDNIQFCVERALADNVSGHLIETGVWRGGAAIFMRALLKSRGVRDRLVWVADSFEGLPEADLERYPADIQWKNAVGAFSIPLDEVRRNFEIYGLLDEQVRFLPGWFKNTLPAAPIERLAVLRLDGDLYESTSNALTHLYPKLSPGGFIIIDDFGLTSCRQAVEDYRRRHEITEQIVDIDGMGAFWRRRS